MREIHHEKPAPAQAVAYAQNVPQKPPTAQPPLHSSKNRIGAVLPVATSFSPIGNGCPPHASKGGSFPAPSPRRDSTNQKPGASAPGPRPHNKISPIGATQVLCREPPLGSRTRGAEISQMDLPRHPDRSRQFPIIFGALMDRRAAPVAGPWLPRRG